MGNAEILTIVITVIVGIIAFLIFRKITAKKDKERIDPAEVRQADDIPQQNKRLRDEVLLDLQDLRQPWIALLGLVLLPDEDGDDSDTVVVSLSEKETVKYPERMREQLSFYERPRFMSDIERLAKDNQKLLEETKTLLKKNILWECTPQYINSFDKVRMFFISDEIDDSLDALEMNKRAYDLGNGSAILVDEITAEIIRISEGGPSITKAADKVAREHNIETGEVWDVLGKDLPALLNARAVFISPAKSSLEARRED